MILYGEEATNRMPVYYDIICILKHQHCVFINTKKKKKNPTVSGRMHNELFIRILFS